ncbi:hypothetical protein PVAND_002500 [Polypedilum vanderplanki]|uniref:FLYWCH-type domain-containing protein n=1 Tax=Polypedilum vanderplanki TaxID=319348 RepID=A0A9J6BRN0_POLVA|nr:hypothetical protein PVAND_002500 [Polypedilum vanderplanki]
MFDTKDIEVAEFIQTNRGGRKLLYKGFSFTQNRKFQSGIISWKCTKYKQWKCLARAVTRCVDDVEYIKISKPIHSHPCDINCNNPIFRFVQSKRGSMQIFYNGNTYTPNDKIGGDKRWWKCSMYYRKACKARIQTVTSFDNQTLLKISRPEHTHPKMYQSSSKKSKTRTTLADSSQLLFISGQRGNPKLVLDGYSFTRNKSNDQQIYWRCTKRRQTKCLAKVVTDASGSRCKKCEIDWKCETFWAVLPPREDNNSDELPYSFVVGQRGSPKILYDGFTYICTKSLNDRKYWVCGKQRSKSCKARVITTKQIKKKKEAKKTTPVSKKEDLEEIFKRPSMKTVYVPTTFGAMKVFYKDYLFTHHYTRNRVARYRCDCFDKHKCPATIVVKESKTYPGVIIEHNHEAKQKIIQ